MRCGLFTIDQGDSGPESFGPVTTAIADVNGNDLARLRIHRVPDPLLVGFLMLIIRTAANHSTMKCKSPGETDTDGTGDPALQDALMQQVCNHGALLVRNKVVFGCGHKLALARFTLMVLFAMTGMRFCCLPVWGAVFDQQ
jgi:hypothetical protein